MLFHDSKYVSNSEVESDETDSDEIESDEEKSVDDEEDGLCKFSPALNSTMKMTCQDLSKSFNVLGFSSEIVSTDEPFDGNMSAMRRIRQMTNLFKRQIKGYYLTSRVLNSCFD